jgi:gliding motility-associated protein GldL
MGIKKESSLDWFYRVLAPKMTSVGAAIVIVGALFKIMHWPGAGIALTVGLLTEAFLFFIGAFQPAPPPEAHYEWERVYPELAAAGAAALPKKKDPKGDNKDAAGAVALDKMLGEAGLTAESFKNFGSGIKSLNDTAAKMKNMSDAVTATNEYAGNVKQASQSLTSLNKAYSTTVSAMSEMASGAEDAKNYHSQVQKITKNLSALNAVYEMELKDANSHLKAMNKFYNNLTDAMQNMSDASKESQVFKDQMTKLTGNLTSLNTIYGNMLSAMRGSK